MITLIHKAIYNKSYIFTRAAPWPDVRARAGEKSLSLDTPGLHNKIPA